MATVCRRRGRTTSGSSRLLDASHDIMLFFCGLGDARSDRGHLLSSFGAYKGVAYDVGKHLSGRWLSFLFIFVRVILLGMKSRATLSLRGRCMVPEGGGVMGQTKSFFRALGLHVMGTVWRETGPWARDVAGRLALKLLIHTCSIIHVHTNHRPSTDDKILKPAVVWPVFGFPVWTQGQLRSQQSASRQDALACIWPTLPLNNINKLDLS
jgi:hypothetical protein